MHYKNFSYNSNCGKLINNSFYNHDFSDSCIKIANDVKKRILIVDDHIINIKIITKYIEQFTTDILFEKAKNGVEALEIFKYYHNNPFINHKIDLIITDLQMPKMNGIELACNIRMIDKKIPIVAFTSITSKNIKNHALRSGFDDYITKPANNNNELNKTILKWIVNNDPNNRKITNISVDKDFSNKKVLIADDESINTMILKKLFTKYSMKVYTVSDGLQLVTKYKNQFSGKSDSNYINKYDIIITDINMPNLDGNKATKIIRNFEIINNVKNKALIIGNSVNNDENQIFENLKSGMDDFFTKGSSSKDIINLIQLWISDNNAKIQNQINCSTSTKSSQDKICNNNLSKEEIIELREEFIKSSLRLIKKIFQSFQQKDLKQFKYQSHALKGISGNFGIKKLFIIANQINNYAKQNQWPEDKTWQTSLKEAFIETTQQLKKIS